MIAAMRMPRRTAHGSEQAFWTPHETPLLLSCIFFSADFFMVGTCFLKFQTRQRLQGMKGTHVPTEMVTPEESASMLGGNAPAVALTMQTIVATEA
jgi:hypothetical protein